jgi:hypothetical protein
MAQPSRSASVPALMIRIPNAPDTAEPLRGERAIAVGILAPSPRSTRCA